MDEKTFDKLANGQIEILSMLLDRSVNPDLLNRYKQTPLMLAAMHGKISCVKKLIEAGANILMFDSLNGRTCLHYAAYYGHSGCLQAIFPTARTSHVAVSCAIAIYLVQHFLPLRIYRSAIYCTMNLGTLSI
ncbi:putative E3 ubiquitin-protein ligase [Forsythia ovata]|uniref:E3 ubiquitin-protein ligase n=1 Tax=Forsythia ovata TaxID=205694 RepID=A0ABD1TBH6_9LAMI